MTVRQVTAYVIICDGCGQELGQHRGWREGNDTPRDATASAIAAGWHPHPDGTHYCQNGSHT